MEDKIEILKKQSPGTFGDLIGLRFTLLTKEEVRGELDVEKKHFQPFGLVHGGVNVAIAESLASVGGWLNVKEKEVVGVEINANHLKAVSSGRLFGVAKPIRIGQRIQVWNVEIKNDKEELTCVSRITLAVV
jgi:uncharacterized protein (TIGR00369 family)